MPLTLCPGWPTSVGPAHPEPVILRADLEQDGRVSHGQCPACTAALHAEMDAIEASRQP